MIPLKDAKMQFSSVSDGKHSLFGEAGLGHLLLLLNAKYSGNPLQEGGIILLIDVTAHRKNWVWVTEVKTDNGIYKCPCLILNSLIYKKLVKVKPLSLRRRNVCIFD